jgi:hypothetical protein
MIAILKRESLPEGEIDTSMRHVHVGSEPGSSLVGSYYYRYILHSFIEDTQIVELLNKLDDELDLRKNEKKRDLKNSCLTNGGHCFISGKKGFYNYLLLRIDNCDSPCNFDITKLKDELFKKSIYKQKLRKYKIQQL